MTCRLLIREKRPLITFPHLYCRITRYRASTIDEKVVHDFQGVFSLNLEDIIIEAMDAPFEVVERHERKHSSP